MSITIGFTMLLTTQCNKKSNEQIISDYDVAFNQNDSFDLTVSQTGCELEAKVCITLDSIFDDSRCPTGVQCIWEGNAKVKLTLSYGGKKFTTILDIQPNSNYYTNDVTIEGYKVKLQKLSPYPTNDKKIKLTDYKALLLVHKTAQND